MALPNTNVLDGYLFHAPCSRFIDSYLGPQLSHTWRHLYTDFRHFINIFERKDKGWLYAYKKSKRVLGAEIGCTRETVTRHILKLESAGCVIRIPSASNGKEGVALIVLDPASIGYQQFIDVAIGELKRQLDSGNDKAKDILNNFLSGVLKPTGEARVTANGRTANQCLHLLHIDDNKPLTPADEDELYWQQCETKTPAPDKSETEISDDDW